MYIQPFNWKQAWLNRMYRIGYLASCCSAVIHSLPEGEFGYHKGIDPGYDADISDIMLKLEAMFDDLRHYKEHLEKKEEK